MSWLLRLYCLMIVKKMVKKNDLIEVRASDLSEFGFGVARFDGIVIFVKGLLIDEVAKVLVLKVNKNYAFAKIVDLIVTSPYRVNPVCSLANKCGGCHLLHLSFEGERLFKINKIKSVLNVDDLDFIDASNEYYYRNKVMVPYLNGAAGFYRQNSHDIVDMDSCYLQSELSNSVYLKIKEYLLSHNIGDCRTIIVRESNFYHQILVGLAVVKRTGYSWLPDFIKFIAERFCAVKSIVLNRHLIESNTLLSDDNRIVFGDGYIVERLGDIDYKIGLNTFFQVNTVMCEKLYNCVVELADFDGSERVLDLYCGVGSIGCFVAKYVNSVVGVDIVKDSIEMARENAELNGLNNIEFVCADATEYLDNNEQFFDVVIVDPPRKGLSESGIGDLLRVNADRIVYISCNVNSLARDIKLLESGYRVEKVVGVNLFSKTFHVETIVLLSRK